jgi:citronellol/citronellal dehydrogenase
MFAPNLFENQIALVTGGGSGIGYTIAEQLLRLGAKVYIASRKQDRIDKAAEQLRAIGPCEGLVCDIRSTEDLQRVAETIKTNDGRLDILINNAGGQFPSPAEDISEKGWLAVVNNNLNGTWNATQTMAKSFFIPQQSGAIVNIIVNFYRGVPGMAHTGAARAGVDNLTKSLSVEWSKYNIRVNAVAPGIIQSSGLENYPPQLLQGIAEKIPMKRLGSVQETAWPVVFLVSPMASYITGETLYVDGGSRLWGDFFPL